MELTLTITATTGRKHVPFLRRYLRAAHALLSPPLQEMSLALVGDRQMSRLHERFMNTPGPTDVLTFPLEIDRRGRATAGEVVICVPEARRQARKRGTGLPQELLLYALHGMLHLCGFDDRNGADYRKMHRIEDDILTQLGIGRVFSPQTQDRGGTRPGASSATSRFSRRSRVSGAE